ncbi:MAG: glycosyltransferase family 9 protein [Acidobacteriota bacterium]|nr:glycosyltransferase family 9 protein [Acidobacteriota bacterium]
MRILLIRLREIGDVVFTTPAVRALRDRYPDARITYVVEPAAAPIVAGNPHLTDTIIAERPGGVRQIREDLALARRLRATRYDLVLDFHGGPRASWLAWATRAPQRVGYEVAGRSWMYTTRVARPRALRPRHSVVNQWDLLTALGLDPPDPARWPTEMAESAAAAGSVVRRLSDAGVQPGDTVLVIHVSAGNPFRRWPEAAFADLVVRLVTARPRRRIVLTAGPSDRQAVDRIVAAADARLAAAERAALVRCGEFDLAELRALAARASLYIGGDSGPLHIAGTTPVPIVALFGPTPAERSMPWRDPALVTEPVDGGALPCRPCEQRHCVPGDFRCLTLITAAQVAAAAERALTRAGAPGWAGTAEAPDPAAARNV